MKNYLKGIEKIEDSDIFNRILYNIFIDKNTRIGVVNWKREKLTPSSLIDSFIWKDTLEGISFWNPLFSKYTILYYETDSK